MKNVQLGSSTMGYLDMFKSSLNSALDRKYFLDRWISVDSLVTLLQQNYDLDFLNKRYVNKYILTLFLKDYKVYKHSILRLKNKNNEIIHKTFFTSSPSLLLNHTILQQKINGKKSMTNFVS